MTLRDKSNGWLTGATFTNDYKRRLIDFVPGYVWHDEKIDKVGQFIEKIEDAHSIKDDLKPDRKYFLKPSRKHAKEKL